MKTFLISYDLSAPESKTDYTVLSKHIKSLYSKWARPVQSLWIIKTDKKASQIRDEIKTVLDVNDKLIVLELGPNWGTSNISKEVTDWMKTNI